ncbi:MAG: transporter [Caldimonas sp.]
MRLIPFLSLLLALPYAARAADDEPTTTPYRPSVSTPAALSAPGWLEVEAGGQRDHLGGGARRDGIPLTLKLAFDPDWGIRLGNEPWVRQRSDTGEKRSGFGDTSLVLKRRFAIDDAQALGLEAGLTAPTGRSGIGFGSGKPDYSVNAIYSADFGEWHTDINLLAARLGQVDPGASRTQWLFAASLSRQLDDRWGVVGEFSGTRQSGAGDSRQLLLAASYNLSKRVTLDAGAARNVLRGDARWSAFAGFTWLAARLF